MHTPKHNESVLYLISIHEFIIAKLIILCLFLELILITIHFKQLGLTYEISFMSEFLVFNMKIILPVTKNSSTLCKCDLSVGDYVTLILPTING